jgi:hypothetical protein
MARPALIRPQRALGLALLHPPKGAAVTQHRQGTDYPSHKMISPTTHRLDVNSPIVRTSRPGNLWRGIIAAQPLLGRAGFLSA